MKPNWTWHHLLALLLTAAVAVVVGYLVAPGADGRADPRHAQPAAANEPAAPEPSQWTCPMHPEVVLPEFGACPKCGMDLVPRETGDDPGPRRIELDEQSAALAQVETATVTRRFVTVPVRLVGKVEYDETRVRTIAARVEGRLDRLYVDYTGIRIAQDDHLVWLYSPDLVVAQQELLEARARVEALQDDTSELLRTSTLRGYRAARDKLQLWGLSSEQVDEVETRGAAEDHMLIRSPTAGIVLQKYKNEGDYVQEGTPIYRIADLSHVWIVLQAYEQDLPWLRYGQTVRLTAEALPGEFFDGRISFLSPTVDERTRTVQVRVNVDNAGGRLKPGMFVRGVVEARIGADRRVLDVQLHGKWISPMHPEIVKDGPGQCDICGMDLVRAEDLGYVDFESAEKPLVVPATAVLVTGRRAVVYVQVPGRQKPTYEGREVVLGPRAGDLYVVESGLEENERVVAHGAFRVDSAMQIRAKPSMMSQAGDRDRWHGPNAAPFRASLLPVYRAYLALQQALAGDDFEAARTNVAVLRSALDEVDAGTLPAAAVGHWTAERRELDLALARGAEAEEIEALRTAFEDLARATLAIVRTFGHSDGGEYVEAYCPMAFDDKGAAWLQQAGELRNPYFGASMLTCGETRTRFPALGGAKDGR